MLLPFHSSTNMTIMTMGQFFISINSLSGQDKFQGGLGGLYRRENPLPGWTDMQFILSKPRYM